MFIVRGNTLGATPFFLFYIHKKMATKAALIDKLNCDKAQLLQDMKIYFENMAWYELSRTYTFNNRIFENTIFGAYTVKCKYDKFISSYRIYINFEAPNYNYMCENYRNESHYSWLFADSYTLGGCLDEFENYLKKTWKMNKYGELMFE